MADLTERTLGYGFGLLGGLLLLVGAVVALALGVADLVAGRALGVIDAWSESVVLLVIGGLALFFAYLGQHTWRERGYASGTMLVIVAVLGWAVLGLGANLVALIGAIFVFLAGILYLLEPAKSAMRSLASAA